MNTLAAWQEPEQLIDQYRVQFIQGEDKPRSRYFIRVEEARAFAESLKSDPQVVYARVDRRSITRWHGVA